MGYSADADKELGAPDHTGNIGGRFVWLAWMVPATGPVQINTPEGSIDTVLAIVRR